jgi:hypothetical protein
MCSKGMDLMGWDACATLSGEFLKLAQDRSCIEHPALRSVFEEA